MSDRVGGAADPVASGVRIGVRHRWTPADVLLFFVALASAYAYGRAQGTWLFALLIVLGIGLTLDGVGERARGVVERVAWLTVGLVVVAGLAWTLYLVVDEAQLVGWRSALGTALALLAGVFLAGARVWSPARGLLPVCFGLLVLSAVGPGAGILPPLVAAAAALVAWLTVDRGRGTREGAAHRVRWAPVFLYVSLSGAVAAGIIAVLPVAQPIVERAARRFGTQGSSGLSENGSLGAIEEMGLSRAVVLRMWSDEPGLLRARVHTHFDGRRWTATPAGTHELRPGPADVDPDADTRLADVSGVTFPTGVETTGEVDGVRVLLARSSRGWLVAPRGTRAVRVAGGAPTIDRAGVLKAPFSPPPVLYGLAVATPLPDTLLAEDRAAALQLPEQLDPRLSALAERLEASSPDDRARVQATVDWLGDCCTYSLSVGAFATDQSVAEFLFEKRRGYCEYFASAAAMLLRLQGIPTRYVTGLSIQPANRRGDYYLARGSDAHAWVEVWLDGRGWVEVDPTPPGQYAALRAQLRDGLMRRAWEGLTGFVAELTARFGADWKGGLAWLFGAATGLLGSLADGWSGALAVVALIVLGFRLRGRLPGGGATGSDREQARGEASALDPRLDRLVSRLEELWATAGHPRPPCRGHLEHVGTLADSGVPEPLRESSREVVSCYYRTRFGGASLDRAELNRLRSALDGHVP